ncbi:hypothetical protein SLA2020_454420 [Shorea laevis]
MRSPVAQEPRACLVTFPNVAQSYAFVWLVLCGWSSRPPHGTETLTRTIEPKEAKKRRRNESNRSDKTLITETQRKKVSGHDLAVLRAVAERRQHRLP